MNYTDDALKYTKGSLYWAEMPYYENGNVTQGRRPVVIVSGLRGSLVSPVVTICPLTTKIKDFPCNLTIKFRIHADSESQILCNQVTTISKKSLLGYIGQLPEDDLNNLNKTLLDVLGFPVSLIEEIETKLPHIEQMSKDTALLESLVPQAQKLIQQLSDVLSRVAPEASQATPVTSTPASTSRKRHNRTAAEVAAFCKDWANATNKAEIAQKYGFSGVPSARLFYTRHKKG